MEQTVPSFIEAAKGYRWMPMLFVLFVGLGLRLHGLGDWWFNPDEGLHFDIATQPSFPEMIRVSLDQANPPLFYPLLRVWNSLGEGIYWLRLLSVLAGMASIWISYLLGRQWGGPAAGLTAALLMALTPGAVVLSQVLRQYTIALVFQLLTVLFMTRYIHRFRKQDLWGYAVSLVLALLCHYATLLILPGLAVAWVVAAYTRRWGRSDLKAMLFAHIPSAIAFFLVFGLHIGPRLLGSSLQQDAVDTYLKPYWISNMRDMLPAIPELLRYLYGTGIHWLLLPWIVFGLITLAGSRDLWLLGLCLGVAATAFAMAALRLYPLGGTRHSLYMLPFLFIPIADAVRYLACRNGRVLIALLVLCALAGYGLSRPGLTDPESGFVTQAAELEKIIPMTDFLKLQSQLLQLSHAPGLIIIDQETYYALAPVFGAARFAGSTEGPFPWNRRMVCVYPHWRWEYQNRKNAPWNYLFQCTEGYGRSRNGGEGTQEADIRMVRMGWSPSLIEWIKAHPSPEGSVPVLTDIEQGINSELFRIHLQGHSLANLSPQWNGR
ncbi:MAG: glycosyltransferase family 39 protein [Deltaproteobacteria bacterium]|nr:glycosyltransferase family 39 protein [Deltaproteobacteria bacterium]